MYLRRVGAGHLLFAVSFALIGAISLGLHEFLLYQQPVPQGLPWREPLACISAALMLLGGIGLLLAATARSSALLLTGFVALWVLALWIPRVLAHPLTEANWLGVGEDLTLVAGGWLIYRAATQASAQASTQVPTQALARSDAGVRLARIIFGLALVPIGLSHFFYLRAAVDLTPGWMPFRAPLTLLAGAGHIAAGLAIACGVLPALAALMEASMESLITLIVWGSAVAAKPVGHGNWVSLLISTAETAAAWVLAASYARRPVPAPDGKR